MPTLIVSDTAMALLRESVASEIEHTRDMIREMPDRTDEDREAIRVERIREQRLEAVLEDLTA